MPALPNFLQQYTRRNKVKTASVRSPFPFPPTNSASSPHPYAAPEIVDIKDAPSTSTDHPASERELPILPAQDDILETTTTSPFPISRSPSPEPEEYDDREEMSPSPQTPRMSTPPRMELSFELSSDSMSDWIPSHLLADAYASTSGANHGVNGVKGADEDGIPKAGNRESFSSERSHGLLDTLSTARTVEAGVAIEVKSVTTEEDSVYEDEDEEEEGYSSSEDIVAQMEAMDASNFLTVNGAPFEQPERPTRALPTLPPAQTLAAPRKINRVPPNIKIPNPVLHGPKVQILRSGGPKHASYSDPSPATSRPDSMYSPDDPAASSVSGTTLARALMGNPYILSDDRASKYRSGGSVLTRADSATLPRDENPFFSSPHRAFSDLPPVPHGADAVYMPPKNPRKRPTSGPRTRQSGNSFLSPPIKDAASPSPVISPLPETGSARSSLASQIRPLPSTTDIQQKRPISRISEVTSLATTPDHSPSTGSIRDNSAETALSSCHTPSPLALEPESALSPRSDTNSHSGTVSTASHLSGSSQFDLEDYYQHSPLPEAAPTPNPNTQSPNAMQHVNGFRPPFSPISEESSSQLSPPSPFIKRDSKATASSQRMSTLSGKFILTNSPSSPGGSIEWSSPSRKESSQLKRLLPIGEVPQSSVPKTPSTSNSANNPPSASSDNAISPLVPPSVFNRQRSGSTPNPIRVIRDSRDPTSYKITVGHRPVSSSASPSTAESEDFSRQDFPETPIGVSPTWSPGSLISPGMPRFALGERDSALEQMFPQTPLSAVGMGSMGIGGVGMGSELMPSLAQQLLTRAASSVQGVRSVKQSDITRAKTVAAFTTSSVTKEEQEHVNDEKQAEVEEEEDGEEKKKRPPQPSWITQHFSDLDSPAPSSRYSYEQSEPGHGTPPVPPLDPESIRKPSGLPESNTAVNNSSTTSLSALPRLPPSPPNDSPSHTPPPPPQPQSQPPAPPAIPPPPPPPPPSNPPTTQTPTPAITPSASTQSLPALNPPVNPLPPPPPLPSQSAPAHRPLKIDSSRDTEFQSLGSPPPYYTLVFDHSGTESQTPSTGGPSTASGHSRQDSESHTHAHHSPNNPDGPLSKRTSTSRVRRPLGPRRPVEQTGIMRSASGASVYNGRERNASVTSHTSNSPFAAGGTRSRQSSSYMISPSHLRFQTPPVKWRGYTMDAAKWTFTSSQLQAIVSRAIKQSAEASFIRLLRLETVDKDIPEELHKLEMQKTDIKSRYRMLARRRAEILERVNIALESGNMDESLRLVARLGEMSTGLDRLTEDLHSVDEQASQLKSLRDIHDASALAMALRKLNQSFLKQVAISEELRAQVDVLEAEKEDAWKQALTVASDYDHLTEKVESQPQTRSNRSSRVMALRKSSVRVSKAGLRSNSSRRSSMSSTNNRLSTATLSGTKSAYSLEDIPPVPPIPRQRPVNIMTTDLRTSTTALSTDMTPNSETRAMVQAHEDLCNMLGINMELRPRRSRSVMERSEESRPTSRMDANGNGRPLSMPDDSGLKEVYNVMTADRNAMLTTLQMLSDP